MQIDVCDTPKESVRRRFRSQIQVFTGFLPQDQYVPTGALGAACAIHPSTVIALGGLSAALVATETFPFPEESNESAYSDEPATQVPEAPGFWQTLPDDAQSVLDEHAVLHAVPLAQINPPAQAAVVPALQVPVPLHVLAVVSMLVLLLQAAARHTEPDA